MKRFFIFATLMAATAFGFAQTDLPYYYRMFGPLMFHSDAARTLLSIDTLDISSDSSISEGIKKRSELQQAIDKALLKIYLTRPDVVQYHDSKLEAEELVTQKKKEKHDVGTLLQPAVPVTNPVTMPADLDIGLKIERPNFWTTSGTMGLQFTQNYFSENWYQGGDNSQTMLSSLLLEAKYDNTTNFSWETKLDMRLGFITNNTDTCHHYITNNDRLELYSKLNLKMINKWFYALSLDAKTQFMPGYKTNKKDTFSDFLSPLDFNLSLGLDYKPSLKNGNSLSIALLPLSYNFRYIKSEEKTIHNSFGMQEDFKQNFGSKFDLNCKFTLAKNLTYKSRLYCYTSYKYVESEWENTFSYALSKYISAQCYTLWRFDDRRPKSQYDDNLGFFQFKEYFTLGLSYKFQ